MKRLMPLFAAAFVLTVLFGYPNKLLADQVGVILMHGKGGTAKPKSPTGKLISVLEDNGFIVIAPDMPWSRSRFIDKDFEEAMAEIDGYVAELKAKGADKIVVGGHSMGANAAIGYGARREGLAGILAIAPGHVPEIKRMKSRYASVVAEARQRIEAGKGDEILSITDVNQGVETPARLAAKVIATWYAPDVGAVIPLNTENLKPGTPLMWIIGKQDTMYERGSAYAFDKAPAHPKSRYEVIDANHMNTPIKGKSEIIDWLKSL